MSQQIAIARPYAKALFALADESGQLNCWKDILCVLKFIADDEQFALLIHRPGLQPEQLVSFVVACVTACVTLADEDKNRLGHFALMLAKKKRLSVLPAIEKLYVQQLALQENVMNVTVTSACQLHDDEQLRLQDALKQRFQSDVSIEFTEDSDLIGGAVIRAGTWVMDGSIKQKLNKLKDSMRG
jgi:F-type H+-transporting ATPase subunit delta